MTKEETKQVIIEVVNYTQGCGRVQLINLVYDHPKVIEHIYQPNLYLSPDINWNDLLDELVKEERLVEVKYVLTSLPHVLKSFLLPADTLVSIKVGT